MKTEVH